ncbi:MAG TPA: 50S ribosomal protein L23 [Candidatus Omnitrophota bacterium]|jgi:large subunit ribosomal protein L23|nr:50S ribosomal protein L23 [Candidatus Omnitrophota bacterium]
MITSYDIIQTLVRTEKSSTLEPQRKYVFHVSPRANKGEIKKAVEEIYSVKVAAVNIMTVVAKRKRVRSDFGYTTPWKKAVVSLKEGYSINVT